MTKTVANRDVPTMARYGRDADGYGAMWTRSTPMGIRRGGYRTGYLPSRLASILSARADSIVQVIYSYGTPIAWLDAGAWIIPAVGYSPTTGKHQSYARSGLTGTESIPADASLDEYVRVLNGHMTYSPYAGKGDSFGRYTPAGVAL